MDTWVTPQVAPSRVRSWSRCALPKPVSHSSPRIEILGLIYRMGAGASSWGVALPERHGSHRQTPSGFQQYPCGHPLPGRTPRPLSLQDPQGQGHQPSHHAAPTLLCEHPQKGAPSEETVPAPRAGCPEPPANMGWAGLKPGPVGPSAHSLRPWPMRGEQYLEPPGKRPQALCILAQGSRVLAPLFPVLRNRAWGLPACTAQPSTTQHGQQTPGWER